jgi:hypothetical protein
MRHRHLNHEQYTLAAIDDTIQRGKREDWAHLRRAALAPFLIGERLLSAAAHLQGIFPGAVLVGGTASAIHAGHRLSANAERDAFTAFCEGHWAEALYLVAQAHEMQRRREALRAGDADSGPR